MARAIRRQAGRGLTYMLPSEDALAIGPLLQQRFGLPFWQIATTAIAANRVARRVARADTGSEMILVFNPFSRFPFYFLLPWGGCGWGRGGGQGCFFLKDQIFGKIAFHLEGKIFSPLSSVCELTKYGVKSGNFY